MGQPMRELLPFPLQIPAPPAALGWGDQPVRTASARSSTLPPLDRLSQQGAPAGGGGKTETQLLALTLCRVSASRRGKAKTLGVADLTSSQCLPAPCSLVRKFFCLSELEGNRAD